MLHFVTFLSWFHQIYHRGMRIIEYMKIPGMETRIESLELVHTKYGVQRIDIRNSTQNKIYRRNNLDMDTLTVAATRAPVVTPRVGL